MKTILQKGYLINHLRLNIQFGHLIYFMCSIGYFSFYSMQLGLLISLFVKFTQLGP